MGIVADLAAIQKKVNRPVYIPDRESTRDEVVTIGRLRTILHEGRVKVGFVGSATASVPMENVNVHKVLDTLGGGTPVVLRLEEEEVQTLHLFGTDLPLGKVIRVLEGVMLANEQEVRTELADAKNTDKAIELRFVSSDNSTLTSHYVDWVTSQPSPTTGVSDAQQPSSN